MADWTARADAAKALTRIEIHERECAFARRSTEQWQQSCERMIRDMKDVITSELLEVRAMVTSHCVSDTTFQQEINKKLGGWNKLLISGMGAIILFLGGAVISLAVR